MPRIGPPGRCTQRNRAGDREGVSIARPVVWRKVDDKVEQAGTDRRWTLGDFGQVRTLREPAVSPDGRRVAVVVDAFRDREDDRVAALYVVAADGSSAPHRLTQGAEGVKAPQWSPDGRYLGFIAARPPAASWPSPLGEGRPDDGSGKPPREGAGPKPQVWAFDMVEGGEPAPLTNQPEGVAAFEWSPDGRQLAIAARTPSPAQAAYLAAIRKPRHPGPWVITRPQSKRDGEGYLDDVPTHLFRVDVSTAAVLQLTDGDASEEDPHWSPDGTWVMFRSNRTGRADLNACVDLWMVAGVGGAARRLTHGDVSVSSAAFSPDGRSVALVSPLDPNTGYTPSHLMRVSTDDATPVEQLARLGVGFSRTEGVVPPLAPGADPVANGRVGPRPERQTPRHVLTQGAPGPLRSAPHWVDDRHVLALLADHGPARLVRVDTEAGGFQQVAPHDRVGTMEGLAHRGGPTVVIVNRPETAGELYRVDPGGTLAALTTFNRHAFEGRAVPHHRWVQFRNPDQDQVEGVLVTPVQAAGALPLIVVPHGGPQAADALTFRFDHQYWAGLGYAVLLVNYRGSVSYGPDWQGVIRGDWGPREHADLMAGVDHLVAEGIADPARLFLTGFSYGGVMTNWAVGHTGRFAAAASEHGMWDYASMFGHGDTDPHWQDGWGVPWQNPEGYRRSSPLSAADGLTTPLLITAGEHDWRCPVAQAEALYAAAIRRGVPAELVVYPGEHHAWQSRPSRARDRIRRITAWFHRYGGPADDAEDSGSP